MLGAPMAAPSIVYTVRWITALPIKTALVRRQLGAEADTSPKVKAFLEQTEPDYVITVEGPPRRGERPEGAGEGAGRPGAGRGPSEEMQNRIKDATVLNWKGHDKVHPVSVQLPKPGQAGTVFRFAKTHPIELDDKDVEFATNIFGIDIRKKFRLKDMVYKGQLCL